MALRALPKREMRTAEYSAQELFDQLNDTDEVVTLEAKSVSRDSSRSLMETICSFSNEPGLGGGVILLGVVGVVGEGKGNAGLAA